MRYRDHGGRVARERHLPLELVDARLQFGAAGPEANLDLAGPLDRLLRQPDRLLGSNFISRPNIFLGSCLPLGAHRLANRSRLPLDAGEALLQFVASRQEHRLGLAESSDVAFKPFNGFLDQVEELVDLVHVVAGTQPGGTKGGGPNVRRGQRHGQEPIITASARR